MQAFTSETYQTAGRDAGRLESYSNLRGFFRAGVVPEGGGQVSYDAETMERLFNPASVVVVGASRKTGPGSFNIVENLVNYGYKGRLYAVNPKASEIFGVPCFPRAADLPEVPDLAIITVPREMVPQVVRDCCERGIKSFILVPQGMAEADETGAEIQAELMAVLRAHGARALGPNTLGTVNVFDGFISSFMPITRRPALPTGLVCQTGLFLATDLGPSTGLGKGIDIGNQADVGFPEALRHLADDPRVKVVAIHMEGLRPGEGRLFLDVLRETVKKKPVLVYKTGRSAAGAEAASSHSGSLAGSYEVYEAALESAGAVLLRDTDDMDDSVKAFLRLAPLRGRRIAVVTASGGGGIMAADAIGEYGLELARLTPETLKALADIYPDWMEPGNPLDVWPAAIGKLYPEVFVKCFDLVADDPNVDGIICVAGAFEREGFNLPEFLALSSERRDKPVVWWLHGRRDPSLAQRAEGTGRVAVYPSPDRAVRALARLARYYIDVLGLTEDRPSRPAGISPDKAAAVLRGPARSLGAEAFEVLAAYGIPAAPWRAAASPEEAAQAAVELGFPVALKAVGPGILHKTELGAVRLDLGSPEEVAGAAREMLGRLKARTDAAGAGPAGEGAARPTFLVQRFLPGGHEVILGAKRDPHFGPTVLFGLGGVFTEILEDVAIGLAPLSAGEAERLIARTKGYPVLRGARGRKPADLEALVDCLVRLSWLVADHPGIAELDLNPVKVFASGEGVASVDARILVKPLQPPA